MNEYFRIIVAWMFSQHPFKKPTCYVTYYFQTSLILQIDNKHHYLCGLGAPVCPASTVLMWYQWQSGWPSTVWRRRMGILGQIRLVHSELVFINATVALLYTSLIKN